MRNAVGTRRAEAAEGGPAAVPLRTARDAVDHLLLGTSDLDAGIDWLEARTGVRASVGGSHPGWGTRNALVSLGPGQYLEVIAPDPAQSRYTFDVDVRALNEPRLVAWAASTPDAAAVAAEARSEQLEARGPQAGSRTRPDGSELAWTSVWIAGDGTPGVAQPLPFFIEWHRALSHPSRDAPRGCHLLTFDLQHPHPDRLARTLACLGIEAVVAEAAETGLVAVLDTPRGRLTL